MAFDQANPPVVVDDGSVGESRRENQVGVEPLPVAISVS
jgi:hypothetical protein